MIILYGLVDSGYLAQANLEGHVSSSEIPSLLGETTVDRGDHRLRIYGLCSHISLGYEIDKAFAEFLCSLPGTLCICMIGSIVTLDAGKCRGDWIAMKWSRSGSHLITDSGDPLPRIDTN